MSFTDEKIETWGEFVDKVYTKYGEAFKLNNALLSAFRRHKIVGQYDFQDIEVDSEGQQLRRGLKFFDLIRIDPDALDIPTFVEVVKKEVPRSAIALAFQAYHDIRKEQGLTGETLISKALKVAGSGWEAYNESRRAGRQETVDHPGAVESPPAGPVQKNTPATMNPAPAPAPTSNTPAAVINHYTADQMFFVSKTTSVTKNITYFKQNAGTYNFLKFAIPQEGKKECEWTSPENLPDGFSLFKGTKGYKSGGKGLALLLSWGFNTDLEKLPPEIRDEYTRNKRHGVDEDAKKVRSKFLELTGNKVIEGHDIATVELLGDKIKEFREEALSMKRSGSPPAYLTVIVSTHGYNGYKLLLDHLGVADLFEDIVYMLGHEAPGFKDDPHFGPDMPRLFFVQACQTQRPAKQAIGEFPKVLSSNFMVGSATIPGHFAWRNTKSGSYYITYICESFQKGKSLHEMLKTVNQKIVDTKIDEKDYRKTCTSVHLGLDFPLTEFKF